MVRQPRSGIRVLHVGKYFPPIAGGIESFLEDLLPALKYQGIHVAGLVHNQVLTSGFVARGNAVQVHAPFPLYRAPCYGHLLYAPVSPRFQFVLRQAIREFQPDVLHLHLPNTSAFWAMALRSAKRIPWIVHWHADVVASSVDRRLRFAYRIYSPLEQRLLATARAIVVTSPAYLAASRAVGPWGGKCVV